MFDSENEDLWRCITTCLHESITSLNEDRLLLSLVSLNPRSNLRNFIILINLKLNNLLALEGNSFETLDARRITGLARHISSSEPFVELRFDCYILCEIFSDKNKIAAIKTPTSI